MFSSTTRSLSRCQFLGDLLSLVLQANIGFLPSAKSQLSLMFCCHIRPIGCSDDLAAFGRSLADSGLVAARWLVDGLCLLSWLPVKMLEQSCRNVDGYGLPCHWNAYATLSKEKRYILIIKIQMKNENHICLTTE